MKRLLSLITVAGYSLVVWASSSAALDPSLDVSQYAHSSWSIQDGSLKGGARCMTQTIDGYIWIGSEFGLVRFDGVRFLPWNPPPAQQLPSNNIRSLVGARDGTLWIGTLEGLASWKDGKLRRYAEFAQQNVLTLLEDREGSVWAGTFQVPKGKLCSIRQGTVECYGEDGSFGQWVWSIYEDGKGQIWVGAETGLWRWKPGPAKRYAMPHAIETSQAVVEGDKGVGLLAIAEDIWQIADERTRKYQIATPPGRLTPMRMLRDRDGGLWIGTLQRGLLHVQQGRTSVFGQSDGLTSDHTLSLLEDREGNIWVGTEDGLDRFRDTSVFSISVKQGLSSPSVESVLVAHDNSVWLSTLDGLNRWDNGRVTIYWSGGRGAKEGPHLHGNVQTTSAYSTGEKGPVTEIVDPGLPDDAVGSLYEDDRHRLWVSTPKEIARLENGRFTVVKEVPSGWVNAITGDASGGVWISYQDHGLVHWAAGKVIEKVPWSTLGGNVIASSVMSDPVGGGIWLGFFQGGLTHFNDGRVLASYGKNEGLGRGRVMGIEVDQDGAVWAATEGGLSRVKDAKVVTLNSANGLPCDAVHWAVEVDSSFWLYTACGLLRIARSEIDKWTADPKAIVHFTILDRSDGVRIRTLLTGYTPRVSKSTDGRVWFANLQSLSVIDPHRLVVNKVLPPVRIEQIIADTKSYAADGELRLPARVRNLTIDYTALSFAVPEKVRFRYRLDGQDPDWRAVLNERQVQYSNLAPGTYRFHVLACNNSGLWNDQGATLEFAISPAWYQTNWFRAGCAAALLGMMWGVYQRRVQKLAGQFNMRLEERVSERTRIARDLHDTLLQSFHGLLFHLRAVQILFPKRPEEAMQVLDKTVTLAEEALEEGRDSIQQLRSGPFAENELDQALIAIGEQTAAAENGHAGSPHFKVIVEGERRVLAKIIKSEVARVAQELLQNAFRHAGASAIEAEIHYDRDVFRLIVRDDGRGIEPQLLKAGGRARHYGLTGVQERAKGIGGRLEFWSKLGAGTEVRLTIPAAIAYEQPQSAAGFRLLRRWKTRHQQQS